MHLVAGSALFDSPLWNGFVDALFACWGSSAPLFLRLRFGPLQPQPRKVLEDDVVVRSTQLIPATEEEGDPERALASTRQCLCKSPVCLASVHLPVQLYEVGSDGRCTRERKVEREEKPKY